MSVCSGYSSSPSLPILPVFLVACGIVAVVLSMLGGAATVQTTGPKPTPDDRVGGIDIDKAVAEAISIIPTLVNPGDVGYISSTGGGLLRVYLGWKGQIFIIGHDGAPGLLAAAEKIAARLGVPVAP